MRLTEHEHQALLAAVNAADPQAQVWLHGSRVRDDARGGDIDLLVFSQRMGLSEKLDVLARLHAMLGEQKIDLTIARDESRAFVRLAKAQGVRLLPFASDVRRLKGRLSIPTQPVTVNDMSHAVAEGRARIGRG